MAWDTRGNGRRPCFHARRVGRRPVKTCIGPCRAAEACARDAQRRRDAEARVTALVEEVRDELAHQDRTVAAFCAGCDRILNDVLKSMNFYYHQGRWRRRRD